MSTFVGVLCVMVVVASVLIPMYIMTDLILEDFKQKEIKPTDRQVYIIKEIYDIYKLRGYYYLEDDDPIIRLTNCYMYTYSYVRKIDNIILIYCMQTCVNGIDKFCFAEELRKRDIPDELKLEVLLLINDYIIEEIT